MATVGAIEKVADREKLSGLRTYKTVTITEECSLMIQSDREIRSQSPSKSKSRSRPPSLIIKDQDQEAFNTRHLQLLNVCDQALAFLACLIKQDTNPLLASPSSKRTRSHKNDNSNDASSSDIDSGQNWNQNREQLDDIFRSLASWRQDLEHGKPQFILHHDGPLISALDGVITSFLTVGHQLTHLNPSRKRSGTADTVLLEVTENLAKGVHELEEDRCIVNDYCAVCSDQEQNDTSEYLQRMRFLVRDLMDDSKPLQLAVRRRDWLEQTASSERRLLGHFDESDGSFHKQRHATSSSNPKTSRASTGSTASQERIIAKSTRRARTMASEDDQNETTGKAGN